ncbi:MAG: hypothetical protein KGO48_03850 [Alphaproteobacteria bacterium]|nr:hypothetical protein [Alphaproteobacteria bacterium]
MVQSQPFGRRVNPQHRASRPMESVEAAGRPKEKAGLTDVAVRRVSPTLPETKPLTIDDDSRESWQTRKQGSNFPWRQLSLMASLCFGIAYFALPDSVNDAVQWLLLALTAVSLYAGFRRRRTRSSQS